MANQLDCSSVVSKNLRSPTQPRGYIVVFDAGSSGTRVHIYNFLPHYTSAAVPKVDRCVNDVQTLKQKPGLSAIAEEFSPSLIPQHVSKALTPLLDFARGFIPEDQWDSTPLVLKATAGLRAVEPAKAVRVISAVANIFRKSGFMFETNWASIIPGVEEGGLAWVTANYLAGTFEHDGSVMNDNAGSLGIIEMGGGSAQVSFRMHNLDTFEHLDDDKSRPTRRFMFTDLSGRRHNIYALSYLGFGQDHAQRRLANYIDVNAISSSSGGGGGGEHGTMEEDRSAVGEDGGRNVVGTDPCYRRSYARTTKRGNVQIRGTGNFQQCRQRIRSVLFNVSMPDQPPLIPGLQTHKGYLQPPLTGSIIATENFWYGRRSPDIQPPAELSLDPMYMDRLGERFCGPESDNLMVKLPKKDENVKFDERNKYCFGLAFQSVLLDSLHATGAQLPRIEKTIGGSDLDWAMGAAVIHFSTHELELRKLWSRHGWELKVGTGARAGSGFEVKGWGVTMFEHPTSMLFVLMVIVGGIFYMLKKAGIKIPNAVGGRRKSFVSVMASKHV